MTRHIELITITDQLEECEAIIEAGLEQYVRVGLALRQIRLYGLYKVTHDTWESYCKEKWGLTTRHALYLVNGASVSEVITSANLPAPENENQTRSLAGLPEETITEVWSIASGLKLTSGANVSRLSMLYRKNKTLLGRVIRSEVDLGTAYYAEIAYGGLDPYLRSRLQELRVYSQSLIYKISELHKNNSATGAEILNTGYLQSGVDQPIKASDLTSEKLHGALSLKRIEHIKNSKEEARFKQGVTIIPLNVFINDPDKTAKNLFIALPHEDLEQVIFLISEKLKGTDTLA